MEDTCIVKGHYAYMFRVDLSCNKPSKLQIDVWLEYFNFSHWFGNHEIGSETGKHHYQMIVWREHKFLQKEQVKARNWWRNKTNSVSHGTALTSARKVATLASYCNKDVGEISNEWGTLCNLCSEQLKRIPTWQNKMAIKIQNIEKLESQIKLISKYYPNDKFCEEINKIYYSIYGRPCTHRNTYIKYLYEYGYMTDTGITHYVFNIDDGIYFPGYKYRKEIRIINEEKDKKKEEDYYKNENIISYTSL